MSPHSLNEAPGQLYPYISLSEFFRGSTGNNHYSIFVGRLGTVITLFPWVDWATVTTLCDGQRSAISPQSDAILADFCPFRSPTGKIGMGRVEKGRDCPGQIESHRNARFPSATGCLEFRCIASRPEICWLDFHVRQVFGPAGSVRLTHRNARFSNLSRVHLV